jgi:hypothetical protein
MHQIDITPAIPYYHTNISSREYAFNPTISHIEGFEIDGGEMYIGVIRKFSRQSKQSASSAKRPLPLDHPWLGGIGTDTWWKTDVSFKNGYDLSELYIVEFSSQPDSDRKIAKTYILPDSTINGVDCRLLQIQPAKNLDNLGVFMLTFNTVSHDPSLKLKSGNCSDWCMLISHITFQLALSKTSGFYLTKKTTPMILYPEISNKVEKNWSTWKYGKDICFSYGLFPKHDIYRLKPKSNGVFTYDNTIYNGTPLHIIEDLHSLYSPIKDFLHISVTTPSIYINKDIGYLAVGHIKFNYKMGYIEQDVFELGVNDEFATLNKHLVGTHVGHFLEMNRYDMANDKFLHPSFVYFMFLYSFDVDDSLKTTRFKMSDAFIPIPSKHDKNFLVFPSGITTDSDGNILVSYGEIDTISKVVTMKVSEVRKMLRHDEKSNASSIRFVHKLTPLLQIDIDDENPK